MLTALLSVMLFAGQTFDCNSAVTQVDMNRCAALRARDADAELNRIWPQVVRMIQAGDREVDSNGEGERRLRAAQHAWIAFRDAQCELEGVEALGGSMESMLVSGCLATMTERRTAELRQMLGGD